MPSSFSEERAYLLLKTQRKHKRIHPSTLLVSYTWVKHYNNRTKAYAGMCTSHRHTLYDKIHETKLWWEGHCVHDKISKHWQHETTLRDGHWRNQVSNGTTTHARKNSKDIEHQQKKNIEDRLLPFQVTQSGFIIRRSGGV